MLISSFVGGFISSSHPCSYLFIDPNRKFVTQVEAERTSFAATRSPYVKVRFLYGLLYGSLPSNNNNNFATTYAFVWVKFSLVIIVLDYFQLADERHLFYR